MRATLIYGAGDIRVEVVPDPVIKEPTDAVVRMVRSCVCGSDLWRYQSWAAGDAGARIGHEYVGVVEDVGSDVRTVRRGDLVVAPFWISDSTCQFCAMGLHTSCVQGAMWATDGLDGCQGEAVRAPLADGTLVKLPVGEDSELLPSLLALSDVMATGHHAAARAGVAPGVNVAVIGDGAVGLCGVLAARRLGAEQIVLLGRHSRRTDLGREFGATDVVAERGPDAAERVRELTGSGAVAILECVGTEEALLTAVDAARPGGSIARVGVPQYTASPGTRQAFLGNVTLTGGAAPARHYIPELLPDVLEGRIQPGRVFDVTMGLDRSADAYRAMADRSALKVMLTP